MIDRLVQMFKTQEEDLPLSKHDKQLAAAALLVEAAVMDGNFDDDERTVVLDLLKDRFELSGEDAHALTQQAETTVAESKELYTLTRTVKDAFDHEERVEMIEMLWTVSLADGVIHDYEANLVRRVSGLLYVSDRESGEARKRALTSVGIE
ncbi:TerB family tellurite resistance protein [Magnetovibrio sp. PR-2]|uniref:tellurite resistance TerB family protein n=1 Tax=Magnetovibrio sp. PR-2 TaxID=3120356 RepID=UPI002FCE1B97